MSKTGLLTLSFLIMAQLIFAQYDVRNVGHGLGINFSFGFHIPGGDLAERFGSNNSVGGGLDFITNKTNYIFGLEGSFIFGTNVETDVLESLRTPFGGIIGNDRAFADIQLRQRGFYVGGLIGKLFSLSEKNPRSGLRVTFGMGLLQHEINIQEDPARQVPQTLGDYEAGYDRLTNGLALNEFIGYQILSRNKRVNLFIGLEFTQAFTRSRRDFNFDTRTADTEDRLDLLFGIRAAWVLPFYFGAGSEEIYY